MREKGYGGNAGELTKVKMKEKGQRKRGSGVEVEKAGR
jgi:hypothetical protein